MTHFQKKQIALEFTLRGMSMADPKFIHALKAYELAKKYHSGMRKDGETPEFAHQLDIVGSVLSYHASLIDPVAVIVAAFLHDLVEDYSDGSKIWKKDDERLKSLKPYNTEDLIRDFGAAAGISNNRLSKVINGYEKTQRQYFDELATDCSALIVKAEDRLNNLSSMFLVFTLKKQREYAELVYEEFIPAMKAGEANFPEQACVYQKLKVRLKEKAKSVIENIEVYERIGFDVNKTIPENIENFK